MSTGKQAVDNQQIADRPHPSEDEVSILGTTPKRSDIVYERDTSNVEDSQGKSKPNVEVRDKEDMTEPFAE